MIGDAMLDIYLSGTAKALCREAPVPIVNIRQHIYRPGGAANTAFNLSQLGAETYFVSVVGDDDEGGLLKDYLQTNNVLVTTVFSEQKRKTLTKQRITADNCLLVRFDTGTTTFINPLMEENIIHSLFTLYPKVDAVIVSDYGYCVITERIKDVLSRLQKHMQKIFVVDSKYLDQYATMRPTMVKPNYQESLLLLGLTYSPERGERASYIASFGDVLQKKTGAEIVALTLDSDGSLIFEKGKKRYQTFTQPVINHKAAGAGDTYTAAFTYALTLGARIETAAEIASAASSIVVAKESTAICTYEELLAHFSSQTKYIKTEKELITIMNGFKQSGKKLVFTNGCFDILHSGHVDYLNRAKQLGDVLIVGLNSDASIRRLKGPTRPVNQLRDRIQVLSGLSSVDYVVPFSTNTPLPLLRKIIPDVYVKGGDYKKEDLVEAEFMEHMKKRVEILPLVKDKSTTRIIKSIQDTTSLVQK